MRTGQGNRAMVCRSRFLGSVAAVVMSAPTLRVDATTPENATRMVDRALVLSGGGARGAYQAGVICGLAKRYGISDGTTLSPYGLVSGTSIGAINAWFTATGQYQALREAWGSIASANIFALKKRYVSAERSHSFILARIVAALRMASGLTTNETGLADSGPIFRWIQAHVDPTTPLLMPMVWPVTNLTTQTAEYFYRLPPSTKGIPERLKQALQYFLGDGVVLRQSSNATFHRELEASTSTPIVFDPVRLEMADGGSALYVDGGIASNVTVGIARAGSKAVDVILVDPPASSHIYHNAIDVTLGSYQTMQRIIIESEMRQIHFESLEKKSTSNISEAQILQILARAPELRALIRDLPITDLAYKRPSSTPAADFASFDNQEKIDSAFALGESDSETDFTPYDPASFHL